jgi:hypothetical protein
VTGRNSYLTSAAEAGTCILQDFGMDEDPTSVFYGDQAPAGLAQPVP